jgi:hypothetical protein
MNELEVYLTIQLDRAEESANVLFRMVGKRVDRYATALETIAHSPMLRADEMRNVARVAMGEAPL